MVVFYLSIELEVILRFFLFFQERKLFVSVILISERGNIQVMFVAMLENVGLL